MSAGHRNVRSQHGMDETTSPKGNSSMLDPSSEAENAQGESNSNSQDMQVKDEPADDGYEQTSAANSRTSSPLPAMHLNATSPQQNNSSHSVDPTESETNHQNSQNDSFSKNNLGSPNQSANSAKPGKKMNSVQNIVEGLRRKSESQLVRSNFNESESSTLKSLPAKLDGGVTHAPAFPPDGKSSTFPISQNLQARVSRNRKSVSSHFKQSIARPKSPTSKSHGLLKDVTNFTYSMMESAIDDTEAAEIFNVQNHELVCAIGSKSLVSGKSKKVFASLDFGHYWCNFCPYTSNNKSALIQHVLEHRFSCRYCPYESFCRSDTMRHMHKMHYAFKESAGRFMYCTLLSDFMRIKARAQGKSDKDPDEDVGDPEMNLVSPNTDSAARKRKHAEEDVHDVKSIRSSLDSPTTPTWSDSESSVKEKGKSRKSQNPKKHAPSNAVEHFDLFDMEVEEKNQPQQKSHGDNLISHKKSPLSEQNKSHSESLGTMQVLPTVTDGSLQTYTSKRTVDPTIPIPPQPPKANFSYRGRKSVGAAGSTSSLYWSCGHCTFQSNGQAEIKEHSSKHHPGKPHRYVALIKNMTPDTYIPHGASATNMKRSQNRPNLTSQTNGARNSIDSDDTPPAKEKEDPRELSKARVNSPKPKRETIVYRCYHCSYTAKRHSSLKTHLYHKHRGKGLVAVEDDSETGQQMFFCARDDCTFKSDNPGLYLNHVDQCTPWNKPELADVEVEPHIRECLDQTIAFAETAREKVNNQCLYKDVTRKEVCEDQQLQTPEHCVHEDPLSPEFQEEDAAMGDLSARGLSDNLECFGNKNSTETRDIIVCSQALSDSSSDEMHEECLETVIVLDGCQDDKVKAQCYNLPGDAVQPKQTFCPLGVDTASCDDSGHVDFVSHSEEDSSIDELKHSMSSEESFIAVGVVDIPVSSEMDMSVGDEGIISLQDNATSLQRENVLNECIIVNSGNAVSSPQENNDLSIPGETQIANAEETSTDNDIINDEDVLVLEVQEDPDNIIRPPQNLHTKGFKPSNSRMLEHNSEELLANKDTGCSENNLYPPNFDKVTALSVRRTQGIIESECLKYLIDSTSDNTDSEENGISFVRSTSNNHERFQIVKAKSIPPDKSVTCWERTNVINFENVMNNQAVKLKQHIEKETHKDLKQVEAATEPNKTSDSHKKESTDKLCFAYVPARSSAQKALSKMKSTLTEEVESDVNTDTETKKVKPLRIKKSDIKAVKTVSKTPLFQPRKSFVTATASTNLATPCTPMSQPKPFRSMYKCSYCTDVGPGSLNKIKNHLLYKHKSMPPLVINCSYYRKHKSGKVFVCPHLSCFKLFPTIEDLDKHKNTHIVYKKPKERTTLNSCSTSSFVHNAASCIETKLPSSGNSPHVFSKPISVSKISSPSPMPEIRSCRVELRNLGISEVQAITQRHKREEKYLCLYCTEYVFENSLSAMKSHYIQEHEGQLMVMRDTEARRAQQPSRIYVCNSPGCEYKCVARNDLDAHIRSKHSTSSCSYVYECALCGWFSSSHASANQHLESQHSPDEGASLVHMQVMVDEFGQTSKKIV